MNLAVCVKSCHKHLDEGYHETIRGTWARDLKALGVETYFFVGTDPSQQDTRRCRRYVSNEVVVDCKDDYESLPVKTRRICQWTMGKTFERVFLCDTDTYINARAFLSSEFKWYDYAGWFKNDKVPGCAPFSYTDAYGSYPECRAWASGGWGYFLSRRAADVIASTPPTFWAEDFQVGQTLAPLIDNHMLKATNFTPGVFGTSHYPKVSMPYKPEYMKLAETAGGDFDTLFRAGKLVA
jgi:hypothetical protein